MNTSDIVQTLREIEQALDDAGRGDYRALKLLQRLDEMGYDLNKRSPHPQAIVAAVEALASIGDAVSVTLPNGSDKDRLFAE